MNRLKKLKEEFWIAESKDGTQEIVKGNIKVGDRFYSGYDASYYTAVKVHHLICVNELDAASAEYEKIIAELEVALEFYNEREITLTKYEPGHKKETMCFTNVFTEKANKALQKLKEFRGGK